MALPKEDKAGLYVTVIVHLSVLIILMLSQIGAMWKQEQSFLIDFSREEEAEQQRLAEQRQSEQDAFDETISRRIDELISGTSGVNFRNVAVDRGALKDDRGTDADKLYEDARRLAQELKDGVSPDEPDDSYAAVSTPGKKDDTTKKEYSGPSVVSYSLDGRKASRLPIPAYRCYGGGMVTVIIFVDNAGNVIHAKVQEEASSPDRCLRDFAVRAARMSKFSVDAKAPARQAGDIVYQFIAQR